MGGGGAFPAAQHASEFRHPLAVVQRTDPGQGLAATNFFVNRKVVLALGGDLREVRDAQDLASGRPAL